MLNKKENFINANGTERTIYLDLLLKKYKLNKEDFSFCYLNGVLTVAYKIDEKVLNYWPTEETEDLDIFNNCKSIFDFEDIFEFEAVIEYCFIKFVKELKEDLS